MAATYSTTRFEFPPYLIASDLAHTHTHKHTYIYKYMYIYILLRARFDQLPHIQRQVWLPTILNIGATWLVASYAAGYFWLATVIYGGQWWHVECPANLLSFRYNQNRNRKKFQNYSKQKDLFRFFRNIPKLERFGSLDCLCSIKKELKEPK